LEIAKFTKVVLAVGLDGGPCIDMEDLVERRDEELIVF
jgi:hypothetical protein